MTEHIHYDRPADHLYHAVPLRHVLELPVLGVLVRFESNSADALSLVEEVFGGWRALFATPERIQAGNVRVRLVVHDGDEGDPREAHTYWRMPDRHRLLIHTPGSVALVDRERLEAIAYVTPALLANRAQTEYSLVSCLTFPLVETCDRSPVHAAAIARDGVAVLLAAPPGTGKSTLAYEAHREGWAVLSDDVTEIQTEPTFRIWGTSPGSVCLTPEAAARFRELAGRAPKLVANGSEKVVVRLPAEQADRAFSSPTASQVTVCLLQRNGERASLTPVSPAEVQTFLGDGLGIARVMYGARLDQALARVAAGGGWRLSLSDDPRDALPLLHEALAALQEARPPALV